MRHLVLTFASQSYEPQFRAFCRSLERVSPDIPLRAIRDIQDPIEMLRRRPAEILKALEEGFDQVIFSGADQIFFQPISFDFHTPEPNGVLFRHCRIPPPNDGRHPTVHDVLRTGTFNSDLQVWNNTAKTRDFLAWYARELTRECVTDFSRGLFFDQTYLNLAPCKTYPWNDHNVAFYNLHDRVVTRRNGKWYVGDVYLSSFHFSGFVPDDPSNISKHQTRFRATGDLLELMNWYRDELQRP